MPDPYDVSDPDKIWQFGEHRTFPESPEGRSGFLRRLKGFRFQTSYIRDDLPRDAMLAHLFGVGNGLEVLAFIDSFNSSFLSEEVS